MKKTWILVADSSHARVFTAETRTSPLQEITDLAHPEGRLHVRDLTTDLPGKAGGSGNGVGHAYESEHDPKKVEAEQFVRDIIDFLHQALDAGRYEQLILVAPPAFLGLLRGNINDELRKRVCYELDKNITLLDPVEVRSHLPELLPC